jgi:broad specificity phosphatase PhoE
MQGSSHREVWFIRNSESVANAGARTREAPTYPLSELGFRQAEPLAAALHPEPDLIIVSPYGGTRQTATDT